MGDIARAHGDAFKRQHALSEAQRKVLRAISACRTQVLGGRIDVCADCGHEKSVFNSCRNRHCPACQAGPQAKWLSGRIKRLLPTDYFHVVFTLPDDLLNGIVMRNRRLFFEAMFAAASQTLLALGNDEKRLGAQVGFTAVLHTWTRDLRFHPHIHCIVTGGGLSPDGAKWKAARRKFLFPVKVLSKLFRGKLMALLSEAYRAGRLDVRGVEGFVNVPDEAAAWRRLRKQLFHINWVSYAKAPFAGAEAVYQYLGRYTHRVGLSNHRLVSVTQDEVIFHTWGEQTASLAPKEFLRRFLQHVLPDRFVKMRHYGLLAPANVNTKLVTARRLLEAKAAPKATPPTPSIPQPVIEQPTWRELLLLLTGIDVTRCQKCGSTNLISRPLPRATPKPRDTS
ncbi:MAG: IS91 family transposase [Sphingobacteriales bacterium]|nr:IS91 family transposase [Sphingobacteriales bacterium]